MPKLKRSKKYEKELDHLMHKVRKLERKIRCHGESVSPPSADPRDDFVLQESASPVFRPDDWLPEYPDDDLHQDQPYPDLVEPSPLKGEDNHTQIENISGEDQLHPLEDQPKPVEDQRDSISDQHGPIEASQETQRTEHSLPANAQNNNSDATAAPATAGPSIAPPNEGVIGLDADILQILGDDPTSVVKYGKDIRTEAATRLVHIATEGLSKEIRKDLIDKYPIPANCVHIGAPKLNPEINAAISENFSKRDKGIESKQKEMASAISCLGEIITLQLNSNVKNNDMLQKLIDLSRILCDIQYADSVTRRNFILFSLKKELKDHLVNNKIDTCLFGEDLTETLKTAKAVNKSGIEIKAAAPKQAPTQYRRPRSTVTRPLNRRGPAPRRPPPGPPPPAPGPRGRAPAPRAPPLPPPAPPARYYRPSYAHQAPTRRY